MSLMQRLMAAKMQRAVPASAPTASPAQRSAAVVAEVQLPTPPLSRGSCKAINPDTGRQCALPSHASTMPHRHGSTSFMREAAPGQTRFTRRDAIDSAAVATNGGSNHE